MKKLTSVHPGEILLEEFLKSMGFSQYRLAKEIGVPLTASARSWLAAVVDAFGMLATKKLIAPMLLREAFYKSTR